MPSNHLILCCPLLLLPPIRPSIVRKVMSLFFNMLSRLVITFLPRSKRLLISWLQSPSAVILEPPKIKSATVSTVSPSTFYEVMGPDAMILVLQMLSFKPAFSFNTLYVKSFLLTFFSSMFLLRLQLSLSLSTVSSLKPLSP